MQLIQINDDLFVGRTPPHAEDLAELAARGIRSVVNFRDRLEGDQPLGPYQEGDVVLGLGMAYLHFPMSEEQTTDRRVDRFRSELASLPRPIFAHCAEGRRAMAMLLMHLGVERNLSGRQTLGRAFSSGFAFWRPPLEQFIMSYVDTRRAAA